MLLPRSLLRGGVCAIMLLDAGSARAATALDCLPPIPPASVSDAAVRDKYRAEIRQEYSAYFDEAQAYLRCLDAARTSVTEDINRAIQDYQALGPEPGE